MSLSHTRRRITRRDALKFLGAAGIAAASPANLLAAVHPSVASKLSPKHDAFLDDLERRACLYFWEQGSPNTGQVRDRARTFGKESGHVASIAATGFGLTALCIADERKYFPASDIRQRVLTTLTYHFERLPQDHGFFFHFSDMETGRRAWNSELSSIDTSILLCGILTCRSHFDADNGVEPQIRELANRLYDRIDWPWMLNGGTTFSMGFLPESGFLKARWNTYCELMMLYLLALGSSTHPVEPICWKSIARPYLDYSGFHYISDLAPLFTHQYTHAWFDFRNTHDGYANYFENSVLATKAHKEFCIAQGMGYSDDYWGVSASDSQHGYTAWGGPPLMGRFDGSIVPSAAAGSLPFLPQECLRVLMSLRENYEIAWGRYGFMDAMCPNDNWYDRDVLGIDQGIGLLMAENLRSQFVWQTFMRNPEPRVAMQRASFETGTIPIKRT